MNEAPTTADEEFPASIWLAEQRQQVADESSIETAKRRVAEADDEIRNTRAVISALRMMGSVCLEAEASLIRLIEAQAVRQLDLAERLARPEAAPAPPPSV